jgi:hypothetical protein
MIFSDTFLDELRLVVKDCLLNGNLEKVALVKQLLDYDNTQFGDFLAPLFLPQDNSIHHLVSYSSSASNLVKLSEEEHESLSLGVSPSTIELEQEKEAEEIQEPTYKWRRKYISPEAKGNLCGIVILTETGCSIEDVESGKVLYEGNYKVVTHFNFYHGAVISFNMSGIRLLNVSFEDYIDLEDGVEIVKNCPIEKDDEGYYVPSDSEGRSLTEFGSICSPFNLIPKVVESYKIATAVSVDLFIRPGSIPRVVWVHQPDDISVNSMSNSSIKLVDKFSKQVEKKSVRVFSKLDFDLKGLKVAVVGLPKSQTERFRTMVVIEKEAEELVFIDSSSHEDQVRIPSKLKDFDIVLVVKRFVGHGTIYSLKSLLEGSSAALVNSTSHGLDALEKALYRGKEGYPSEEGTVQVPYPYK